MAATPGIDPLPTFFILNIIYTGVHPVCVVIESREIGTFFVWGLTWLNLPFLITLQWILSHAAKAIEVPPLMGRGLVLEPHSHGPKGIPWNQSNGITGFFHICLEASQQDCWLSSLTFSRKLY